MPSTEEIEYFPTPAITTDHHYTLPSPSIQILRAGVVQVQDHRPLLSDIVLEKHTAIPTRDGSILYADIYRPSKAPLGTVPAIIAAGPFGKDGGPNKWHFNQWPWRFGCPRIATSGLEKFEGPDPGYWCYHGYAIVHTDCRGVWESQGEMTLMPSKLEGQDNYDIIEFIAAQEWCNGKVSMAGNSYLSMTQYWTGAENPPHLACLAPWEGISDLYEDQVRRGGIPNPGFIDGMFRGDVASATGSKSIDFNAMCYKYPHRNSFWNGFRAEVEKIKCPIYMVASWTNALHTNGTLNAWQRLGSQEKWLRVHNSHEWPDFYDEQNVLDLRRFFDYYMKGVNNDWKYTPPVRLSILNPGAKDIVNRPESSFPLERQSPLKLYLDSTSLKMQHNLPARPGNTAYDACTGQVQFKMPITSTMEFTGYIKLRLWMEARGSDDMDVFTTLSKYDPKTNQVLESTLIDVGRHLENPEKEREDLLRRHLADNKDCENYFDSGPMGCIRASHRELDEAQTTMFQPVYLHQREQLLQPGEIVPLDIAIWPYGMICNPGEELRVTISGANPKEHLRPTDVRPQLRNQGMHVIHTSGERDSYLLLPLIPVAK
ncbi:hydrolase CocE/NonD family protein [Penicillium odoratum]|uniref:hydrolase CocE/NonD family protein n=1 Tax=Penicillium odoratum TaxID=1167516 RepID=UPI00254764FE|nr:hydrolase CocE/NonD family protein [Penicillium odoratum]KAJ5759688.1 hydrolase CocE/NonD family protein [Penicillium odoratum]